MQAIGVGPLTTTLCKFYPLKDRGSLRNKYPSFFPSSLFPSANLLGFPSANPTRNQRAL